MKNEDAQGDGSCVLASQQHKNRPRCASCRLCGSRKTVPVVLLAGCAAAEKPSLMCFLKWGVRPSSRIWLLLCNRRWLSVTVQGQCHYYYGLIGLLIGLLLSLVFLALVLRILLFAEPLRSPGYAYKTLTSRPAFKPRWRLPALAYRHLIPVATCMRVSPATII